MADDWDDDDFGTFESADVGSPIGSTVSSSSSSAPAWLLTPQAQQQVTASPSSSEQHDKEAQPVAEQHDKELTIITNNQVDKPSIGQNVLETVMEENQQKSSGDNLNSEKPQESNLFEGIDQATQGNDETTSSIPKPTDTDDAFADIFGSDEQLTGTSNDKTMGNTSNVIAQVALPPPNKPVIENESQIVAELKSKLDNALILQRQAEKITSEIQEEFANTVKELNDDIELKEAKHRKEVEVLNQQKNEEIEQVKDEAQQSMKALTEQYTNLCSQIAKEQQLQFEKQLGEITKKCVELLELQQSTIDNRIAEEVAKRSSVVDELLDTCKRDVKEFVTSQCDDVVDRCFNASQIVEQHLKERIVEVIEIQRKVDLQSKEDAMQELTKMHKEETKRLMSEESSKFNDATRRAVQEAQRSVQDSVKQQHEQAKRTQGRHLLALKMLLTSSQEHLRHLTEDAASPTDEDS
uniref:Trichohyalin n=1 Tax=Phallusia mammillata TaxID=59560 RepID=A0A6F9D947_9ASCI|nr:trichohyalin [Phallusia mammillata]